MKRLFLLRHAKTEQANKDTPADSDRRLTEGGRNEALRVGRAMREKDYLPDLILCSPSMRTRQTLDLARAEFGGDARIEFMDALYAASAGRLLQIIRDLPDSAERPLLVGHNPGFEECAALLAKKNGGSVTQAHSHETAEKFPTSALAVFELDICHWNDAKAHAGALADFIRPQDMKS